MSFSTSVKALINRFSNLVKEKKTSTHPVIGLESLRYIWNHQIVVISNRTTIYLVEPLINLSIDLKTDLVKNAHLFPFIVGNNGQLISPNFGRRVTLTDKQKSSIYLEYPLREEDRSKVILRIIGCDPQSIKIITDERVDPELPIVLFLWKSNQP